MDTASDSQLLERFHKTNDQDAFSELVRRHGSMVLATTRRVLARDEDAEDAFQATLFAFAKSAGKLRNRTAIAAWLHKTAFTCAIAIHRRNRSWQRKVDRMTERILEAKSDTDYQPPESRVVQEELRYILDQELAGFKPKLRDAFVLCELEGLTQQQAAEQLGVPTSTVGDRIAKSRRLLRDRLTRRGITLSVSAILAHSSREAAAVMTAEYITVAAVKSARFAAGSSAAELGVSATVVQIANKVLSNMKKTKYMTTLWIAATFLAFGGVVSEQIGARSDAYAGTILLDDFSDGSATDGTPANWAPLPGRGTQRVENESLVITARSPSFPTSRLIAPQTTYSDISVRSQVRVIEGESIGIAVRFNENAVRDSYAGLVQTDGTAIIGIGGVGQVLAQTAIDLDPSAEDVNIQFDVIGDQLSFWVWSVGEMRPLEPTISAVDDTISAGQLFLWTGQAPNGALGTPMTGAFRYVQISTTSIPIPEPSTATLSLLGICGLLGARSSLRKQR
jgi:RNA polymerase sigma factor (sigma-70 family)